MYLWKYLKNPRKVKTNWTNAIYFSSVDKIGNSISATFHYIEKISAQESEFRAKYCEHFEKSPINASIVHRMATLGATLLLATSRYFCWSEISTERNEHVDNGYWRKIGISGRIKRKAKKILKVWFCYLTSHTHNRKYTFKIVGFFQNILKTLKNEAIYFFNIPKMWLHSICIK